MAERHRSKDGKSETRDVLRDTPAGAAAPSHQGRAGGEMQRKVGTRDEEKRHDATSAGATRPQNQDKNDSGDKEKV